MAESNQEPPVCPCGFWGSSATSGLCSKCFKERSQNPPNQVVLISPPTSSSGSSSFSASLSASPNHLSSVSMDPSLLTISTDLSTSLPNGEHSAGTPASSGPSDSSSSATASVATATEPMDDLPQRPVQKNKKRCFKCKQRLELAFTEIGRCKCDYVFCELHRLPEQHDCIYDHKERGRQEALDKMISPKKHIGTSLKRLDSADH